MEIKKFLPKIFLPRFPNVKKTKRCWCVTDKMLIDEPSFSQDIPSDWYIIISLT
jgi:hypothetical protein